MLQLMPGKPYEGPPPSLTPSQAEIAGNLRAHVRMLAEQIGPRNFKHYQALRQTAEYAEGCLRGSGYSVVRQAFTDPSCPGLVFENLATADDRGPFTVVGAHYDSVFDCPGANDNASGVAALLELARLLQGESQFRFVLFTNEEPPFYKSAGMGSVQYVQELLRTQQPVASMVCLETVGYYLSEPGSQQSPIPGLLPDVGDFVAIVGDVQSANFVKDIIGRWQTTVPFPCRGLVPEPRAAATFFQAGIGMSDHASFWDAGVPACMVCDTVFYRYPHYHKSSDTWEKVSYEPFGRMVEGLAQVLKAL